MSVKSKLQTNRITYEQQADRQNKKAINDYTLLNHEHLYL